MLDKREGESHFIGETTMGLPYPVFFDPHYAIQHNKPPVTSITGSPGSGKTFLGLLLAAQSSLSDKLTFVIDPKGDFPALNKLYRDGGLNKVEIWSVFDPSGEVKEENQGMLDPTLLGKNTAERTALTVDVIKMLAGDITARQQNALVPIIRDVVADDTTASFQKVAAKLMSNRDDEIRSLGFSLDTSLRLEPAKLIVRNKRVERRKFEFYEGTTVASLLGLDLPAENKKASSYTNKERIAVVIMTLLTSVVMDIMKETPKTIRKTLIIDEAWAIMGADGGQTFFNTAALLGRSFNMATILITQTPLHLESEDSNLDTTISTRFVFRNDDMRSNYVSCEAMRLPENVGWEESLTGLNTGECMLQDSLKQNGIVQIIAPNAWKAAFNTNPYELLMEQHRLEELEKNKQKRVDIDLEL